MKVLMHLLESYLQFFWCKESSIRCVDRFEEIGELLNFILGDLDPSHLLDENTLPVLGFYICMSTIFNNSLEGSIFAEVTFTNRASFHELLLEVI